ncbi:MAG TPA: hypothetical protein VH590_17145 [Ktedonobacterales bacterium]|jgi:hypothetical protein
MTNQSDVAANHDGAIINIRKLVALDMVFHRPKLILAEFILGVFGSAALAVVIAAPGFFAGHVSLEQILVSGYILCIGLNYVPLLLYAISIARRGSAQAEVAFELAHKERYACKYSDQSFLLLLPLVVPILAISQEWQKNRK